MGSSMLLKPASRPVEPARHDTSFGIAHGAIDLYLGDFWGGTSHLSANKITFVLLYPGRLYDSISRELDVHYRQNTFLQRTTSEASGDEAGRICMLLLH